MRSSGISLFSILASYYQGENSFQASLIHQGDGAGLKNGLAGKWKSVDTFTARRQY